MLLPEFFGTNLDFFVSRCRQWGRFINKKRGEINKNRGERQKNSENQVTLDSIFGASKKHYLSNFVLYML
jgi:hypothetical protein